MPPQTPRAITSYFQKLPTSPAAKSPTSLKRPAPPTSPPGLDQAVIASSSTTSIDIDQASRTLTTTATISTSHPTSMPPGPSASSQVTGTVKSSGGLSERARKAIEEGLAEGQAEKKAKLENGAAAPKVADIFLKPGPSTAPTRISVPTVSTVSELRSALESKPKAKSLLQLELDTLGEDWLLALQEELTKPYFLQLKEFVSAEQKSKKIFPPAADIYAWSRFCPLKDVRVVIIGQDPYHDDGQAHGLCFSVRKGMRIPPSLRNIYKQMTDDIPGFVSPKHGDLTEWAKHGVLLLNTSLTVRAHEAASHSGKGWETFTAAVLKVVTSRMAPTSANPEDHISGAKGVVFMAWGAHAQKMCVGVDSKKHLVLRSAHPSPLAANKGFFGNQHFKTANDWLEERYGPGGGIDWNVINN